MLNPHNLSDILIKKRNASHRIPLTEISTELKEDDSCSIESYTPTEFENAVNSLESLRNGSFQTNYNDDLSNYEHLQLDDLLQERINNMTLPAKDLLLKACQKRNCYFVEFFPELTQLLGCNIAPYFLGNPEQAKSIIYYIIKYVTKDKASIAASLTLLKKSCENVILYPSVAENSGTDVRNATHLVTKFINSNMGGLIEVSEQQAVMHLLDFSESVNTHSTINMFVTGLISSVIAFAGNQVGINEFDSWEPNVNFPSTVVDVSKNMNFIEDTLFNGQPVENYINLERRIHTINENGHRRRARSRMRFDRPIEPLLREPIAEHNNPSEEIDDMTNLDRINTHSHNDVENTVETILHPDDLPNVFNRVPLYRNEINAIIAVPQDEFYRKRCQWDHYRYKYINNDEFPYPGHKVIIEIRENIQHPLPEWQINYYKYLDEGIASMSFREWVMCMKVEKRPEGADIMNNNISQQLNSVGIRNAAGRKPNGRYPLNESCVLFMSHENVQKSIIQIPIYASGTIPKYPGRELNNGELITDLTKSKQDEWAVYILCVFDRCNIDGIPCSLVSNVQLGARRGQEIHLITGRPVYEINTTGILFTDHGKHYKILLKTLKSPLFMIL